MASEPPDGSVEHARHLAERDGPVDRLIEVLVERLAAGRASTSSMATPWSAAM